MDNKTKEKVKGKSIKIIIKILFVIIFIAIIAILTAFLVKKYIQNSEETEKYSEVYDVISDLESYQGDCTQKQGEELIDLLIKDINKYSNNTDKRVSNIKVTYYTDSVKKDETQITYNGSIDEYVSNLENVKTRISGSNKIHVIYQYNDLGYIISCNMYIYTVTSLQNRTPENLVEFPPYVPPNWNITNTSSTTTTTQTPIVQEDTSSTTVTQTPTQTTTETIAQDSTASVSQTTTTDTAQTSSTDTTQSTITTDTSTTQESTTTN